MKLNLLWIADIVIFVTTTVLVCCKLIGELSWVFMNSLLLILITVGKVSSIRASISSGVEVKVDDTDDYVESTDRKYIDSIKKD